MTWQRQAVRQGRAIRGQTHSRLASQGITRARQGRWIGGVCAGLGRKFGVNPNTIRIAFVLSMLLPGPQVLLYILAWVLIPADD